MKVWSLAPTKPPFSREVTGPYNYIFSDNLPEPVTDMIGQINAGNPGIAPAFGQIMYATTVAGTRRDVLQRPVGMVQDVQFYIRATTLRLTEGGGAVHHLARQHRPGHPRLHPVVQRSHGVLPLHRTVPPQRPPSKSVAAASINHPRSRSTRQAPPPSRPCAPRPDHPEWDTAIWLNVLGVPGTPGMFAFYREMEQWMRNHYNNNDGPPSAPSGPKAGRSAPTSRTPTPRSSPRASPRPTATASHRATTGTPPTPHSTRWIRTRSSATPSWTSCCLEVQVLSAHSDNSTVVATPLTFGSAAAVVRCSERDEGVPPHPDEAAASIAIRMDRLVHTFHCPGVS